MQIIHVLSGDRTTGSGSIFEVSRYPTAPLKLKSLKRNSLLRYRLYHTVKATIVDSIPTCENELLLIPHSNHSKRYFSRIEQKEKTVNRMF